MFIIDTFSPIIYNLIDLAFLYFFFAMHSFDLSSYVFFFLFNSQSSIVFCLGLTDSGIFWLRAIESNHRPRHCTDCTSSESASRPFLAKYYKV